MAEAYGPGPAETMSRDELGSVQQTRLRGLIDRLVAAGGVQGARLRDAGVTGGADITLGDLPRLPFTTKQDLWDSYPYGMLAVPMEDVVVVHGSSGSRGRPTLVPYTRADLELWAQMCARSLVCAGAGPGSVVHNAYGYGLFTGGLGIHQGAIALGATVVPMSGGMTDRQVRMIADLRPDVLTCTPSYAVRLGEAARAAGVEPAMKAGLFGAEPWSEELRTTIEELLGLAALDIYGLSEVIGPGVATECLERDGLHVNEDHFIVEALGADGTPVPEGVPGELVFSTPRQAMPLLRYRTGDIASLSYGACPCGRTLVRMSKVLGRADDMLVIRGVNVYPREIESVLLRHASPHYQVVVDRRATMPRLIVACEEADTGLAAALAGELGLSCDVRELPTGTIPRVEIGKAVRVITWTTGAPPLPGL
jgi:phenylacetate-coenzyme A ligase PaaK-like adenylate-forming protein